MRFSDAFNGMDKFLHNNLNTITCNKIFQIKKDFYDIVETLSGSTANLTGITELLVFRFLYHALGMTGNVIEKSVHNKHDSLSIGKRFIGSNGKIQEPDIVIENHNVIKYLFSIKNLMSTVNPTNNEKESPLVQELININGVCTTAIQDIFRINNIRHGPNSKFKSITVIFSDVPKRHQKAIDLIHDKFNWHRFLILENNNNLFLDELKEKLGFTSCK
ncbi:hypothetical protein [Neobacillus bataviensis]|uniref:hypothetical protein n=1 Tax=Neobacillus bataviensis TaxID=220685 RepID=UPI001CBEDAAB|nr:hypothetical protein [Neobacillus bataviensis]